MSGLLLDTHIWFWYLTSSERLPPGMKSKIVSSRGEIWLSPISVWELSMLALRRRIELSSDPRAWISKSLEHFPVKEARLNNEIALTSQEIDLPHRDPADRFLAATALVYDLALLTLDRRLIAADWLTTFSD